MAEQTRTDTLAAVLAALDGAKEELAELALRLGNSFGPAGEELPTAEEALAWYRERGIEAGLQPVAPGRANVVARIAGPSPGRSLMFNAHLDTEASGPDYDRLMQVPDVNRLGGWRDGDRLFGQTILNDRGCMAAFMVAGRALCGRLPAGELLLASVVGEVGQAPVDEFQGPRYLGKGVGTAHLVEHGPRPDLALIAETTGNAISWYHCGACYYKVTLRGRNMYTPRLIRPPSLRDHPNAIVKAAAVVEAIEAWAIEFERSRTHRGPCGEVRPKAQVGAIRGGLPWRPNRSSPYCALYVDVRTLPGEDPDTITAALRAAVEGAGVDAEVELVQFRAGQEGRGVEPLRDAIVRAHRAIRGCDPPAAAEPEVVSMWRDANVFNAAGIPSAAFGPSRNDAAVQGTGYFDLADLVDAAKMYALIALDICAGVTPAGSPRP